MVWMSAVSAAAGWTFDQMIEGATAECSYTLSDEVYQHFLAAFDDRSPIHVDDEAARQRGFKARIMHGAILNGFLSHFVGTVFPGERATLLSVEIRYLKPCYLGTELVVRGNVTQRIEGQRVVVITFELQERGAGLTVANGRALVKMSDGERIPA